MTDQITGTAPAGLPDEQPRLEPPDVTWRRAEDLPWTDPSPRGGLLEVFRQRYLLRLLVRREISARYSGSFLGLVWSYINPLSQFLIYFVVIGVLFRLHAGVPNFAIHMFSAIIIVHYFTETFNAGTRSIVRNRSIVQKMAVPTEMFPVASMLVSLWHVLPQVIILTVACAAYGWTPDPYGLAAIVLSVAIIMVFGTGLALLFSAANVFFRDWSSVVSILTNFVRFGVPMIYTFDMVDQRFGSFAPYYMLNPIANAVVLFQRGFWQGSIGDKALADYQAHATMFPDHMMARGLIMLGVSVVFLVLAQLFFRRLEHKIPERL